MECQSSNKSKHSVTLFIIMIDSVDLDLMDNFTTSTVELCVLAAWIQWHIFASNRMFKFDFIPEIQNIPSFLVETLDEPVGGRIGPIIRHPMNHRKKLSSESKTSLISSKTVTYDSTFESNHIPTFYRLLIDFCIWTKLFQNLPVISCIVMGVACYGVNASTTESYLVGVEPRL